MSAGRLHGERGQILPLLAVGLLVVLLGITALVVDVGRVIVAKRQLQAGSDAAALAGAQLLPDGAAAVTTAESYAADAANVPSNTAGLTTTVTTRCLLSTPQCTSDKPNVVAVSEQATVNTTFARLLGIDTVTVKSTSTASQSVSTAPLDVALVIDRTASMSGQMANLRAGVSAFLDALDPAYARVALVVLPPVPASGNACSGSRCDYYPLGNNGYVVQSLTNDFAALKADVNGLQSAGTTSYKQALVAAMGELQAHGRAEADKVIVFETDGAANSVPDDAYVQPTSWTNIGFMSIPTGFAASGRSDDINRPCGSAVDYVASTGVKVYTVGFHLSGDQTCYQAPHKPSTGWRVVREPGIDAPTALQEMAQESGGSAYVQEDGSQLAQTFAQVATQIQPARLVPNSS